MEWMEGLSDDYKNNEGLKKFTSIEALAKSYLNMESMQGSSIRMAGPDASVEDRAKVYNRVMEAMPELVLKPDPNNADQTREYYAMQGVPEDVGGYDLSDINLDEATLRELANVALKTNMSKLQFRSYAKQMAEMQGVSTQQNEDSRVRMGAELKTVWGMAFEDRYAVVEKFVNEREGLGSVESLSPNQMVAYYDIAKSLTGSKQVFTQPGTSSVMTPDEAKSRIAEIDANPKFRSGLPQDRFESARMAKERIELMRQSDPAKYG